MTARPSLQEGIQAAVPTLRKTTTKEYTDGPSPQEIEAITKVYDEKSRDSASLAAHFNLDAGLLETAKPASAEDFAKGMFAGQYTKDKDEASKKELLAEIRAKLVERKNSLRQIGDSGNRSRINTDPDIRIAHVAEKLWVELEGNLAKLAHRCEVDLELLKGLPPADADEFARQLLAGFYTNDKTEAAKMKLRETLKRELLRTSSKLRKSNTKDFEGPSADVIASIAKFFPAEVDKVVEQHGLSADLVKQHPAKDSEDFARKVLGGTYTQAGA